MQRPLLSHNFLTLDDISFPDGRRLSPVNRPEPVCVVLPDCRSVSEKEVADSPDQVQASCCQTHPTLFPLSWNLARFQAAGFNPCDLFPNGNPPRHVIDVLSITLEHLVILLVAAQQF